MSLKFWKSKTSKVKQPSKDKTNNKYELLTTVSTDNCKYCSDKCGGKCNETNVELKNIGELPIVKHEIKELPIILYANCGECWKEECDHFKIKSQHPTKDNVSNLSMNNQFIIECQCDNLYLIQHNNNQNIWNCIKCNLKVITSKQKISDYLLQAIFPAPRNKCTYCQALGYKTIDKFIVCDNCCGYGGIGSNLSGWQKKCAICKGNKLNTIQVNIPCTKCHD